MRLDLHYVEPRLVELYELSNGRGPDTEFYLRLARELRVETILDLGCGTGLLTRELALHHPTVVGVDPSPAMLGVARRAPGAERVRWVDGDSSALPADADLVLMTGNVAQVFLGDEEWDLTLQHIRSATRIGGHLAFETRNPAVKAWERWNREETFTTTETPYGLLDEWLEVVSVNPGSVVFEGHNVFRATNETLVARSELRFRTESELRADLERNGFEVRHVYGNWESGPVSERSPFFVFVCRRVE
ncbi:MAG: class I SAM-dependent methyltransferase [Candidatus Eisenbacteria bacterium]